MKTFNRTALAHKATKITWALFFISLPITSFPYFPSGLGGKTLVRPLATYPLIILCLLITLPRLLKRPLPRTFLPLLAFAIIAMICSVASLSADLESLRGVTLFARFARNIATLGLGLAFYFTVSLLPETWDDLKFCLRWLYTGFGLALLWGSFQAINVVHFSSTYFALLNQIQSIFSTRKLFASRISGLTYEPKWFAEQLCFLLIPWLLASVLSKHSIFGWQWKIGALKLGANRQWVIPQITIETLLLGWATVILVFTFSRTGLLILGVLIVLGFLISRRRTLTRQPHQQAVLAPTLDSTSPDVAMNSTMVQNTANKRPHSRRRTLAEAVLLICSLLVALYVVGSQNPYFSRFWRYWTDAKSRNRTYLEFIAFEQRFTYWETAFYMFEAHPLLGVGLGNYAFYFDEMLPDQLYRQAEIIRQTTPEEGRDRMITPKNLLARLLAETGLLGTAAFITFLLAILGCVLFLWFSQAAKQEQYPVPKQGSMSQFWGLSGVFVLIVFAFLIFSFDSFALPNMWVVFGLITAAAHIPAVNDAEETNHISIDPPAEFPDA